MKLIMDKLNKILTIICKMLLIIVLLIKIADVIPVVRKFEDGSLSKMTLTESIQHDILVLVGKKNIIKLDDNVTIRRWQ